MNNKKMLLSIILLLVILLLIRFYKSEKHNKYTKFNSKYANVSFDEFIFSNDSILLNSMNAFSLNDTLVTDDIEEYRIHYACSIYCDTGYYNLVAKINTKNSEEFNYKRINYAMSSFLNPSTYNNLANMSFYRFEDIKIYHSNLYKGTFTDKKLISFFTDSLYTYVDKDYRSLGDRSFTITHLKKIDGKIKYKTYHLPFEGKVFKDFYDLLLKNTN